jgi:hypothetical protein
MNGARLTLRPLLAGLALLLGLAPLSAPPGPARAQSTYIPRPPEPDSVLYPVPTKDPRVAPRDAHNPFATDPHVPKSEAKVWVNRDYYSIGIDEQSTFLIPVVENGHLGPKTNPRGFWPRYNEGNMIVALAELKYVLWVFPNHPQALHLLGIVSKRLHDTSIPIAFYEKALRLFPDRASTRAQYGAYLVDVGERAQGILQLEHALRLDPMNLTARAWLDKARRGLGIHASPAESAPIPKDPPAQSGGMYVPRR